MPSIKDLKKRIVSVKNTQQTTKAMKMVSAAKLRRAQEAILHQRPYAKRLLDLLGNLVGTAALTGAASHPLLKRERQMDPAAPTRVLLVVFTSDRGLCGSFNGSIIKFCQRWMQENAQKNLAVELAFVGRKGHDFFKTKKFKIYNYFSELGGKVSFLKAKKLADDLVKRYLNDEVDEVKFIYNEFKNAVLQKVVIEDFLPLAKVEEPESTIAISDYIVKPSPQELLNTLLEKNFAIQAFRIMLESQAGEHGARMSAMENATKNAGEMIKKLTLLYNKQRQAGITKELLEIISGSESQKAS